MVASRVTRVAVEVVAAEGTVGGVTRVDQQVGGKYTETTTGDARVSRVATEVVGDEPTQAGVVRTDLQVGALARGASSQDARVTRVSVEVVGRPLTEAAVVRADMQVGGAYAETNTETVRISRVAGEAVARQGDAGPVEPLALATDLSLFFHNWIERVTLKTSYRTAISTSPDTGAESRRGLRLKPQRSGQIEWTLCEREELDELAIFLRRITNAPFQLPVYRDARSVTRAHTSGETTLYLDTTRTHFQEGMRIAVVETDPLTAGVSSVSYHLVQQAKGDRLELTAALGVAVTAGATVFPMMDVQAMLKTEAQQVTARTWRQKVDFQEVPGKSALRGLKTDIPAGTPQFDRKPIFATEPNWIRPVERSRERQGAVIDLGRGSIVDLQADRSREAHKFLVSGCREDVWPAVEFFDTRRGRLRSFFLIDQDQLYQAAEIDAGGNFVGISEFGDFTKFQEEFDYVGLVMANGDVYVRDVITIQQVLTVFRLTLGTALPAGLSASDVVRVARARLVRYREDVLTETWDSTGVFQTRLDAIEVLDENPYNLS